MFDYKDAQEPRRVHRQGNDVTAKAEIAPDSTPENMLAPDTSRMNFYRADPALTDLLRIHLPDAL
jgi:hypothetical protein